MYFLQSIKNLLLVEKNKTKKKDSLHSSLSPEFLSVTVPAIFVFRVVQVLRHLRSY